MARIRIIGEEEAEGLLREIYDQLTAGRGQLAEVHKLQSLRPKSILRHMALYMEIIFTRSELSRAEPEMTAVVLSAANIPFHYPRHALQRPLKKQSFCHFPSTANVFI